MKLFTTKKSSSNQAPQRRQSGSSTEQRADSVDLQQRYAFRRNRTIMGSSSPQVASSNEMNAELRSPRAHVHHLSSIRRRLLGYLGGVLVIGLSLYLLLSQLISSLDVQVSNIGVLERTDQQPYQQSADAYFAARPTERLRFLLNETEFLSHMQARHPEIQRMKIEGTGRPGEAILSVSSREAIARWSISGDNQYVDAEGTVFSLNYGTVPSLQIVDNSGIRATSTQSVASHRFLGFVGRAIGLADRQGLTITKVTIPALTTRQLDVRIKGTKTSYKLSIDRSVGQQVEDMARIQRYLSKKNKQPGYVDVRIEGKAFYK